MVTNFDNKSVFMPADRKKSIFYMALREGPDAALVLGELESDVLEVLWERQQATAQEVLACLETHGISLSTVQSTLERLMRKRLLKRTKHGRAFVYRAVIDREQLIGLMMENIANRFANGRVSPMISGFCSFVEDSRSKRKARDLAQLLRRFLGKREKT